MHYITLAKRCFLEYGLIKMVVRVFNLAEIDFKDTLNGDLNTDVIFIVHAYGPNWAR